MRRVRDVTPEGWIIKALLARRHMTLKELGAKIGKSNATICDIISGKNQSRETLELILNELQDGDPAFEMTEYEKWFVAQMGNNKKLSDMPETDDEAVS
ncbi:MAG: helix-turn-helix domain-containing protein [Clostridiales bacterium]|nr:helix-turn-helix domain-containing protein [Clostridiales bacterium]